MAEDVPDVSTAVFPSGESKSIFIDKNSPERALLPESWDELCTKYNSFLDGTAA
jgi:hypothetical protein